MSLRQAELGSFAMPREWTDWGPTGTQAALVGVQLMLIDAPGLLALTELLISLKRQK